MRSIGHDLPDLAGDYGLRVEAARPHPGGFESDCLVADDRWFVKIWRKSEQPAQLGLLVELQSRGIPVPAPIPTVAGGLHAWWQGRPYAVFPFVCGRTAGEGDWRVTVQMLARIHGLDGIELPPATMDEPDIRWLRERLEHPWIRDRGRQVAESILRLERAIGRAKAKSVANVVCHRDFGGLNLLIDDGCVVAVLDWEQAVLGPREHDVWMAAEGGFGEQFLAEYGASDLDPDHLEYALLARALRDMAARVRTGTDRPGVETWGFRRIARLDSDMEMFRPFCM